MSTPPSGAPTGTARRRNHVREHGRPDGPTLLLVHGFGTSGQAWQRVLPALAAEHRVITLDQVGAGASAPEAYDRVKYSALAGYAADVAEVCEELDLRDVVLVGHSVGSMVVAQAALLAPDRVSGLVMLAPSARYVDDPAAGYDGGFSRQDIDELLDSLDANYFAWTAAVAPMVMGTPDRPELGAELTASFRQTDPGTARDFARVTFLSDCRELLPRVEVPTLVLQCRHDALAPEPAVAEVVRLLPRAELVRLRASGHCPHLSAPEETAAAVLSHLRARR